MRLRTEPKQPQIRLRTPRVPSVPSTNDSFLKALTKEIFLFDQSFFIAQAFKKRVFLFDHGFSVSYLILRFQTKLISLWKLIFQPKFIFQLYFSYLTPAS